MATKWDQFTKSISIKTSQEKLYYAFATAAGMQHWFLRTCEYKDAEGNLLEPAALVSASCSYRWLWFGYGDDVVENGKVLAANGSDLFEFTFNANGKNDMKVKVTFAFELAEWRVVLHQYNIPEDEESKANYFVGCGEGWTFYLANLKSILEGGIDLRNKNEQIKTVINS